MTPPRESITRFLTESNAIEGIFREPTEAEVIATFKLLDSFSVTTQALSDLQAVYAPGMPLRDREGMNVRVGNYTAPRGGSAMPNALDALLFRTADSDNPWRTHCEFEMLHPFMDGNGRTGRALWAWHMLRLGRDPFALGFLHRFYYQTLENSR